MRKVGLATSLALVYLLALTSVAILWGASQDVLFFNSDLSSILIAIVAASLVPAIPLALLVGLLFAAATPPQREKLLHVQSQAAFAGLIFGFFLFAMDRILGLGTPGQAGMIGVVFLAASLQLAFKYGDKKTTQNITTLAWGAVALLIIGSCLVISRRFPGARKDDRKNMILFVFDGLGARYLSPYDRRAPRTGFATLAAEGLLYTQMRTNKAWTDGYFSTLYSGSKGGPQSGFNLLGRLQEVGVRTMWIAFHNGGLPDARHLPYRGLRSSFLSQRYVALPKILGLAYNVFIHWRPKLRGKPMGEREHWLAGILGRRRFDKHLLDEFLPGEVEYLRKDPRPFFLVVHVDVSGGENIRRGIWEGPVGEGPEKNTWGRIVDEEYVRRPEDQPFVDHWEKIYWRSVALGMEGLHSFYHHYQAKGWDEDTLIFMTADHGTIFSEKKIWYGFHNDEEVTRVPLLLLGHERRGRDHRLCETIDLTRTILSHFGAKIDPGSKARSLLKNPDPDKDRVTSLTRPSFLRNEFFLNVYEGKNRYVFNLPAGPTARLERLDGFSLKLLRKGPGVYAERRSELGGLLADYGFVFKKPQE